MPRDSHDSLVKATFSQVEYAADEFRCALPPALVERLDLDRLRLCPGSFVTDELRKRSTDLLYSVPLDGRNAFLYLLLEHQSTVDARMPYRLWRYMGAIWAWYLADHGDAATLPAIIPLVLHHSDRGWTAPTSLAEMFALDAETRQALGEYLPRLQFVVDDLSVQADDQLQHRAMAAVPRLALWALKNARHAPDLVARMRSWVGLVREVASAPNGVRALALIVRYILDHSEADPTDLLRFMTDNTGTEPREVFMTGAEKLRQEGREQGREQGRDEALRSMLTRQLRRRFGELPQHVVERVGQARAEQLEVWGERVITSDTLDQIFS